jgi:acetyl-CoA carboxylase biotin carboxyl carrier protein
MATIDVLSEVAGTVWKVEAQLGQSLAEEDVVLVVVSMKMEIPLCAPQEGRLLEILVAESDTVAEGDVVARLQAK